jgi:pimeloyl-ACP methyl ester carboxylesterase
MKESKIAGYAPVNGLNMYYEIHGNGTIPLVLIHGGGSTIESTFGTILPMLSAHNKIIAVELQAHGRTSDRNAPESFEQDADDVAGLLAHLNIGKANFLGFSNGGTTTLQIAMRHPHIINKIVVASANYKREGMIAGFFESMPHATLDNMPAVLQEAYLKVTPSKEGLQTMFEKDRDRMINFKDISDDAIRSIKAPALLIVADHDVMTVEHVVALSHLIEGSQLIVLPGTHGSIIGEAGTAKEGSKLPGIIVSLVEEFLSQ